MEESKKPSLGRGIQKTAHKSKDKKKVFTKVTRQYGDGIKENIGNLLAAQMGGNISKLVGVNAIVNTLVDTAFNVELDLMGLNSTNTAVEEPEAESEPGTVEEAAMETMDDEQSPVATIEET